MLSDLQVIRNGSSQVVAPELVRQSTSATPIRNTRQCRVGIQSEPVRERLARSGVPCYRIVVEGQCLKGYVMRPRNPT